MSAATNLEVTSDATLDATGLLGFGTCFKGEWFSEAWVPCQSAVHCLQGVVFYCYSLSHLGSSVVLTAYLFQSDNEVVVRSTSQVYDFPDPRPNVSLHKLLSVAAHFSFTCMAQLCQAFTTKLLMLVSDLCHVHWQEFRCLAPGAQWSSVVH